MAGKLRCDKVIKDGRCCCNCKFQIKLLKYPLNSNFGKGSIMDSCGWVCLNPEITEGKSGIYFDKEHGICETHTRELHLA